MTDEDAEIEVLRRRLIAAEAVIEQLTDDLDGFLHLASHDLQEPARHLQAFAELIALQSAEPGGVQPEVIEEVTAAAIRLERLVRDLLGLYTQTSGVPTVFPIALDDCIGEVVQRLGPMIAVEGASVIVDPLPTAMGDRVMLARVFENLITNALTHRSSRPPRIHVFPIDGQADEIRVAVADNGVGIDTADLERIFEPFVRVGAHSTRGSGIGLAAVRRIINRLGGRIWVESTRDSGTTFFMGLPAADADVKVPTHTGPQSSDDADDADRTSITTTPARHRDDVRDLAILAGQSQFPATSDDPNIVRVLLVEDNAVDARAVSAALVEHRPERFEVTLAPTLADALALLDRGNLDFVLTDLNLPDSGGLDTLDAIVHAGSPPVVVLTVLDDGATGRAAISRGAQDFVAKHSVAYSGLGRLIVHALDREMMSAHLRRLASSDPLTGLLNRRGLHIEAERLLAHAKREGEWVAVVAADIVGLKAINDEYGHSTGDQAIEIAAKALMDTFRVSDVVARLGGDEFGALMIGRTDVAEVERRLQHTVRSAAADALPVALELAIGSAEKPARSAELGELLELADQDLYRRRRERGI